jgi:glycerophosphoryl diester phosphodiesterase
MRRGLGLAFLAALGGGMAAGLGRFLRGWGEPSPVAWTLPLPRPILGAHRGGARLYPENTLEAFRAVVARFACPYLELDVRASRDGVPVVFHDATLERTTDGRGEVRAHTLAELKRLDAAYRFRDLHGRSEWSGRGVRIPTLEEVLAALPERVFSVEIKQTDPPIEAAVVEVVRRAGRPGRVLLGSARHVVYRRIRALAPELPSFFSRRSAAVFLLATWCGLAGWYRPLHHVLAIPPRLGSLTIVTARLMRAARRLSVPVLVWTVNDPAEMERLLALRVDGIITDRPDLLAPLIAGARYG